jgi:NAD(P)-dependent dehydrogenase (short-subunit alcohol dehydrogenase family)
MTDKRDNEDSSPVAAITGAGAGLGRQLALGFAEQGYRVFGTALSSREVEDLQQTSGGSVRLAIVDVTDDRAVRSWAERITAELGDQGVDMLISNAGILTPGPLEVLPLQEIRHEFEVDVFGSLAVINAFLPALRRARGLIVQLGSATGRFPVPFNGPSCASKAALEAFADVYRAELKSFGVHFVIVEPGNMATGGPAATAQALQKIATSMTVEQRVLYGDAFAAFSATFNGMQSSGLGANAAPARGETRGRRTEADESELVTQTARRIWEAFCRHKSETSHVYLRVWEEMDPEDRTTMMSLAAEIVELRSAHKP